MVGAQKCLGEPGVKDRHSALSVETRGPLLGRIPGQRSGGLGHENRDSVFVSEIAQRSSFLLADEHDRKIEA